MKTIHSKIQEAENNMWLWVDIANDPEALVDRNKTKEQAEKLVSYFDGMRDGLIESLYTKDAGS